MSYEPLEMIHPGFHAGTPAVFAQSNDGSGEPAGTMLKKGIPGRYPPVTVRNAKDEEYHRSLGYLAKGEAPAQVDGFYDYPKMLVHPDYEPGTPDEVHAKPREEGKPLETFLVKGSPEKFPPVIANDPEEEAVWNSKGYHMPKLPDPASFQRAKAMPFDPHRKVNGYPRWENGVLVNDPSLNSGGVKEYPKWVGDKLVNSAKEEFELLQHGDLTDAKVQYLIGERRHLSEIGDDAGVERIEKMLTDNGIEVKDRPHGTTWTRLVPLKVEELEAVPVKQEEVEPPAEPVIDAVRSSLISFAEARGLTVDPAWSNEQIIEAMAKGAPAPAKNLADEPVPSDILEQKAAAEEQVDTSPKRQATLSPEQQAEKADLVTEAEARGIRIDKRWSIEKIRAALDQPQD